MSLIVQNDPDLLEYTPKYLNEATISTSLLS